MKKANHDRNEYKKEQFKDKVQKHKDKQQHSKNLIYNKMKERANKAFKYEQTKDKK